MPSSTTDKQGLEAKAAAAERRRTNKPIMEKKRRQRINDCLNQLKNLVLEGLKKDVSTVQCGVVVPTRVRAKS